MLRSEQEFFHLVKDNDLLKEYLFTYEGIINEEDLEDIWSIYQIEEGVDVYQSLQETLYTASFDFSKPEKVYNVEHSMFYDLLSEQNGARHIAVLV